MLPTEDERRSGFLERLTARLPGLSHDEAPGRGGEPRPSKALPRFLSRMSTREAPVLLDLGPVVGDNVAFFGERLGCKLLIEDLYADVERLTREKRFDTFKDTLETRLSAAPGSVDGVLCWDLFDFLDQGAARALAARLVTLLSPGGMLLGYFETAPSAVTGYQRFVVKDAHAIQLRPYGGSRRRQLVLSNRDIERMFSGLRVTESFLLLSKTREVLLRKPPAPGSESA